ncbi:MAG: ACT domain-containing protein [Ruminococcus sp.]|nr:ACT domain-containing protein [Ruminococcus sp.]
MDNKNQRNSQLIVAEADMLPEVFSKVIEVKKLIAQKGEKSSASACRRVGISRSAFYKYKNSVFQYEELITRRIVSIYLLLSDSPGVLSSVLAFLHSHDANILTVNQSIPSDGAAAVNISLRMSAASNQELDWLYSITELNGVLEVKILSAE